MDAEESKMRVFDVGRSSSVLLIGIAFLILAAPVAAELPAKPVDFHGDYAGPFFPDGRYLTEVPVPEAVLDYPIGSRPPKHADVIKYFEQLAASSDRMILKSHGETYEARERWAGTAYITRESMGKGQVILIAGEPIFRGYCHGTERLLINAILYGPGMGARSAAPY